MWVMVFRPCGPRLLSDNTGGDLSLIVKEHESVDVRERGFCSEENR
jgi:hypothetical protein